MEATVRPGNPNDSKAATRLFQAHLNWINVWFDHADVHQRPDAPKRIRAMLEKWPSVVAEVDGVMVGFITCELDNPRILELWNLYVDDAYRGQGIGTAMVKKLEEIVSEMDFDTIMATVSAYYFPGKKLPESLFRRLNYEIIDIAPGAQMYFKRLRSEDPDSEQPRVRFSSKELF